MENIERVMAVGLIYSQPAACCASNVESGFCMSIEANNEYHLGFQLEVRNIHQPSYKA